MPDMIRTVMVEQKMMYEEQIAQLRAERDEARLASMLYITALREQRDEARREILESLHPDLRESYAAARGWDCFKEER